MRIFRLMVLIALAATAALALRHEMGRSERLQMAKRTEQASSPADSGVAVHAALVPPDQGEGAARPGAGALDEEQLKVMADQAAKAKEFAMAMLDARHGMDHQPEDSGQESTLSDRRREEEKKRFDAVVHILEIYSKQELEEARQSPPRE